jgi:hypothetical protein
MVTSTCHENGRSLGARRQGVASARWSGPHAAVPLSPAERLEEVEVRVLELQPVEGARERRLVGHRSHKGLVTTLLHP